MDILDLMRRERYFDLFLDTDEMPVGGAIRALLENGITNRLERGGYAVVFWTSNAATSEWVKAEFQLAMQRFPQQVLPVLLGDASLPEGLADRQALTIRRLPDAQFDQRDIDDLIAWLYWLIHSHRHGEVI